MQSLIKRLNQQYVTDKFSQYKALNPNESIEAFFEINEKEQNSKKFSDINNDKQENYKNTFAKKPLTNSDESPLANSCGSVEAKIRNLNFTSKARVSNAYNFPSKLHTKLFDSTHNEEPHTNGIFPIITLNENKKEKDNEENKNNNNKSTNQIPMSSFFQEQLKKNSFNSNSSYFFLNTNKNAQQNFEAKNNEKFIGKKNFASLNKNIFTNCNSGLIKKLAPQNPCQETLTDTKITETDIKSKLKILFVKKFEKDENGKNQFFNVFSGKPSKDAELPANDHQNLNLSTTSETCSSNNFNSDINDIEKDE